MPLSEEEENELKRIAENFYVEDPKFAINLSSSGFSRKQKQRAALGVLLFLAGLGLVVLSVALQLTLVGVLAFIVMLGGSVMGWRAFSRGASADPIAFASSLKNRNT
jgi:hypothetical protein